MLLDCDDDPCQHLKQPLENHARIAALSTRTTARSGAWQVEARIAINELEAWYFGDWSSVHAAYPRLSESIPEQREYRNPDSIHGGAANALQHRMRRANYARELPRIRVARMVGARFRPDKCTSPGLKVFWQAVMEASQPLHREPGTSSVSPPDTSR